MADIAILDDILPAFEDQHVVVHLGGDPNGGAPWESVLRNNIVGTYNVIEAARLAGVGRVVFASSNDTVGTYYDKVEPYRTVLDGRPQDVQQPIPLLSTDELRPCCYYGVGKAFGESLASYYHDRHGISCICIRIGGVSKEQGWHTHGTSGLALWLSHRDAAQLVQRSIDAPPSVGYAVVYGTSNNTLRFAEIETAEQVLGYTPQDDAGVEMPPNLRRTYIHSPPTQTDG